MTDDLLELNNIVANRFDDNLLDKSDKTIFKSYDTLTKKLLNKNLLSKVDKFIIEYLKIYRPMSKFSTKIFLSLWLISGYPDIILDTNFFVEKCKNKIKEELFNISAFIITKINDAINNEKLFQNMHFFTNFNKLINKYSILFNQYKSNDLQEKVSEAIQSWIIIKKNINKIESTNKYNDNEKKEIILMMINNLNEVKKFIDATIKNFDFKKLELIVEQSSNIESNLIKNCIQKIKLKLDNHNYEDIKRILIDIQKFIKEMNKIQSDDEIEEIIDPEYIIQLLSNNLLDKDTIINFGLQISNHITKGGSIRLSELRIEEIQKINNNISNINEIFANILYINLESIYLVIDELFAYKDLTILFDSI